MSSATEISSRLKAILPILACPTCLGKLRAEQTNLVCGQCARTYPVRAGVPVLLPPDMQEPGIGTVSAEDPVSRHPYSPAALDIIQNHTSGWVLDLGAGGKLTRYDNVIQLDIFRYPMTDVVGTADRLPFRDNAFQAIVSQAVFEHLQYPEWAATEIRRVLQPQGIAKIDTAFLQPEHGYPHHFFNASETGLRHWFREFDIQWSGVEPYQHPKWSLSWFLSVYVDRIDAASAAVLKSSTIEQLLAALQRSGETGVLEQDIKILGALDALPAHALRVLAAGVSVHLRNPPKAASSATPPLGSDGDTFHTDGNEAVRKLLVAREQIDILNQRNKALREKFVLLNDKTRYLAQFYPGRTTLAHLGARAWVQFRLVALLRVVLPRGTWFRLRHAVMQRRSPAGSGLQSTNGPRPRPFVSIIVEPHDPLALIDTFFSLVRQTYSGWELIIRKTVQQTPALTRCLADFSILDERVRVVHAQLPQSSIPPGIADLASGEFILRLPEGATLAFDAIHNCVTLARNRPSTRYIMADFECGDLERGEPMRCYATSPIEHQRELEEARPSFVLCSNSAGPTEEELLGLEPTPSSAAIAYIPKVLYHFAQNAQPKT